MDWSKKKTLKLIELYKMKPILWDPNHEDYKDIQRKKSALCEIGQELEMSKNEIDRKLKNLQRQFAREMRRIYETPLIEVETYESTWFGFQPLIFLKDRYARHPRHRINKTQEVGSEIFIENPEVSMHSSDLQSTSDSYMFERDKFTYCDENEFKSDYVTSNPKRMHFTSMNEKDELDANIITGKKYACDLRGLTTYQRIFCEKIINDAIYYAKLGKLTENSCITNLNTTNESIIEEDLKSEINNV